MDSPNTAHTEPIPRLLTHTEHLLEAPGVGHRALGKQFSRLQKIPQGLSVFPGAHRQNTLLREAHGLHRVQSLGPDMPHEIKGLVQIRLPERRVPEEQERRVCRVQAEIPPRRKRIAFRKRKTGRLRIRARIQRFRMGRCRVPLQPRFDVFPDHQVRIQHNARQGQKAQRLKFSRRPEGSGINCFRKAVQNGLRPVPESRNTDIPEIRRSVGIGQHSDRAAVPFPFQRGKDRGQLLIIGKADLPLMAAAVWFRPERMTGFHPSRSDQLEPVSQGKAASGTRASFGGSPPGSGEGPPPDFRDLHPPAAGGRSPPFARARGEPRSVSGAHQHTSIGSAPAAGLQPGVACTAEASLPGLLRQRAFHRLTVLFPPLALQHDIPYKLKASVFAHRFLSFTGINTSSVCRMQSLPRVHLSGFHLCIITKHSLKLQQKLIKIQKISFAAFRPGFGLPSPRMTERKFVLLFRRQFLYKSPVDK